MVLSVGTSVSRWAVFGLIGLASGLRTTPGSPCASTCSPTNDTLPSEVVCLDSEYNTTEAGRKFEGCIACQLQSTFVDDASRESDVEWGLFNLRFAFSSCVYGYPEKVSDISNSCPVACKDLETSVEYDLDNPSGENIETWCDTASFADNEITDCNKCYNLTSDETHPQVYLANFLESLRYNCHFQTPTEQEFPITPSRIFSESLLPSSSADLISGDGGGDNSNLALIIAMPILGFVILLCILALACFFFIRSRRKKARRLRQPAHLHARWNDTGISTPQWAMEYPAQAQGMYGPGVYSPESQQHPQYAQSPGFGFGFGFVDNDGRGQEVGYSKAVEPVIASPSTAYSPEEKGPQAHMQPYPQPWPQQYEQQMYFPPPPGNGKGRQE
ncbi:uncharacterized protein DSM5745_04954 [Aspergillus mulundensis]|uniref:Uncharacterized protein n=1 Tax=Aspergillus mulundensis TaxID=1810919 RepID=A0A3D8S519_9EURO|nr:Uncharacterized protein DSM5745_04954 [Aspergillus mulundensis]RDW81397.1 Uncharacterized protein DSM5745_04954 [Aspergillus mulundensis]